jgi:redox-sensitive bicupin YhaK (pirin superfamily)
MSIRRANLPSALKMTAPRYQEVKSAEIPLINDDDGTRVRVVWGSFWGKKGQINGIAADPVYGRGLPGRSDRQDEWHQGQSAQ